jgi:hypothetical protein
MTLIPFTIPEVVSLLLVLSNLNLFFIKKSYSSRKILGGFSSSEEFDS